MASRVAVLLASGLLGLGAAQEVDNAVHIRPLDGESGEEVPARVYVWRGDESVLVDGVPTYQRGDEQHFIVRNSFQIHLPPGEYRIRLERGLEFLPAETTVKVEGPVTRDVTLRRWIDLNKEGWFSGDLHVHRNPDELPDILLAEHLNFAPAITTHVWSESVRNPFPAGPAFPLEVAPNHVFSANSQEVERIQGGPGAVLLIGPNLPLPFDGYEHYPPAVFYTREIHKRGGYVEGDKPFWLDTFVNVALGEIDFIELNCNHFLPRQVNTDIARWSSWRQGMGYIGSMGLAHWVMDLYYKLLNCGFRLPLSAGTASGVKAAPVGYNRVYVRLDEFSYDGFLEGLKAGRSFSTNGPVPLLEVNEQGPGSEVTLEQPGPVQIRARVRSAQPLERVEVVVNGRVAVKVAGEGRMELEIDQSLEIPESSWVALRAFAQANDPRLSPTVLFGHTSPVYVLVGGRPIVVPQDARYLRDRVDELISYTESVQFREERHRRETLDVYREARQIYDRLASQPQP